MIKVEKNIDKKIKKIIEKKSVLKDLKENFIEFENIDNLIDVLYLFGFIIGVCIGLMAFLIRNFG